MRKIILASASPRRKELLERAGVDFEVLPASGDENQAATAVWAEQTDAQTNTVTVNSGATATLGKPHDTEDAVNTLKKLQANTHQVYTGVSVWEKKEKVWTEHTFYESTDVTFYPVSDEEIREYVATGEPMDKAGSYGIQGLFGIYVKGISGEYNNVVGLPVARLFYEMKKSGINLRG